MRWHSGPLCLLAVGATVEGPLCLWEAHKRRHQLSRDRQCDGIPLGGTEDRLPQLWLVGVRLIILVFLCCLPVAPSFSASSSSSSSGCQLVRQSGLPCELAGEAAVLIAASTNDALSRNQSAALCRRVSECGVVSSVPLSEPDSRRPLSCASLSVLLLLLRRRTRACSRGSLSSRLTRVQRLTKFRQECMANLNSRVIQFSLRMRARENQFHLTHSMNPPRLFTFVADEALT